MNNTTNEPNKIIFHVFSNGEPGAGIRPFSDEVTITFKHQAIDEEIIENVREMVKSLYDADRVLTSWEYDLELEHQDQLAEAAALAEEEAEKRAEEEQNREPTCE